LLPVAVLTTTLAAPAAQALVAGERERICANDQNQRYTDYYGGTYTGDASNPSFAPFRVVIPTQGWNGKLLAYARGTGSAIKLVNGVPVDVDGYPLVNPTIQAPLLGFTPLTNALPEITAEGLVLPTNPDAFEEALVCASKYAAVVSDYKPDLDFIENGKLGWVVEDGVRDIGLAVAQARRLLNLTQGRLPSRTILMGRSQGSLIALRYAEERSPLVDGVVTACTVGAGASRSWDTAVDFALAIDVAFADRGGWPWGEKSGDVGNVKDDVVFNSVKDNGVTEVAEWLGGLFQDQTAFARFEFVRLVTGLPREGFYPITALGGYTDFSWLGAVLLFATEVKADLEDKAGGAVGQNRYHVYSLSPSDQAYLQTLLHASGASVDTVDTWLDAMNARNTYAGSLEGADYTAAYRDFTFDTLLPPRPILSVHTTTDGLVLPSQETVLRQTLDATGQLLKKRQLRQVYVEANGHCTLTQAEWTVALEAMERRLDTGVWPGNAFFPNNMGGPVVPEYDQRLRFNNAFNPGPFPQPPSP
jgi:pimeloyl-ACP methyl ester carboxylesterase